MSLPSVAECGSCAARSLAPKVFCPHCGSADLSLAEIGRRGAVFAFTRIPSNGSDRNLVLVDVDGVRVLSPVDPSGCDFVVGDPVVLVPTDQEPGFFAKRGEALAPPESDHD